MTESAELETISPLLVTKLHRPRPSALWVARPRVMAGFEGGLHQRLVLISAPAGYGKTAAVSQWLDTVDIPSAWYTLDQHDNDLATFLEYVLATMRAVYPGAGRPSELMLRAPDLPSPERLAESLLHDLVALPGPLILVLDEYQAILNPDIHTVMSRVLQYLPSHVHLIITTRTDPPLPLERLRGRGQMSEIRSADLRFTTQETTELLRGVLDDAESEGIAALLEESTEGWAVGLQLAAASLRGWHASAAMARGLSR